MTTEFPVQVHVGKSRTDMGEKAAAAIGNELKRRVAEQGQVRVIFAAAPSQLEMLEALRRQRGIDWRRITAFHMDEYLGLSKDAPQLFSRWLRRVILDHLPFAQVHCIEPGDTPERTAEDYADRLDEAPIDMVLAGIGVNGHLAFNDPPADLNDPAAVKIVQLDDTCRRQQVGDGCFATLADVPTHALTLTVPRLLKSDHIFCCVPGAEKRTAVHDALALPVSGMWPATALRLHPQCSLFLDPESAPEGSQQASEDAGVRGQTSGDRRA